MNINGIEYKKIWCMKCGYEWLSKLDCPVRCARCRAPKFWEPKKEHDESIPPEKRKQKYPIQDLLIGEKILLSWNTQSNGWPDVKKNNSMLRAIRQEEARKGKKFQRYSSAAGLLVKRVS